jgi:hypothetical protein
MRGERLSAGEGLRDLSRKMKSQAALSGLSDVYSLSCPKPGAGEGVGNQLHGADDDSSLTTFTFSYAARA